MEAEGLMTKPLPVLLRSLGHCVLLSATVSFISSMANETHWWSTNNVASSEVRAGSSR